MSKNEARLHHPATLSTIRRLKGEKQQTLPAKAGISEGFLANLETGRRQPSAEALTGIAAALDVPVDAIGTVLAEGERFCPHCTGGVITDLKASA